MADQLGVSFSPLDTGAGAQGTSGQRGSPLQDAIKILSFRMPTVVGAQGVSPLAGNAGDSTAEEWLKNIFKGLLPPTQPGAPGQPVEPTPAGPTWTGVPTGLGGPPNAPPVFGGAQPPGPPPGSAPPPVVITTPPNVPKTTDVPPIVAPPPPSDGPPDYHDDPQGWKDWMTGHRF